MGDRVPWFWKDEVVYTNEPGDDYQFNTAIYDHGNKYDSFSLIEPCIAKLGCSSIGRIKANLRPKTLFHRKTLYHTDYPNPGNGFTSIPFFIILIFFIIKIYNNSLRLICTTYSTMF